MYRPLISLACTLLVIGGGCSAGAENNVCLSLTKTADIQNSFELFKAAQICWDEKEKDLSSYFYTLGQLRGLTDMIVYSPNEGGVERVADLYSLLYFQYGGLGRDELFTDLQSFNSVTAKIKSTSLSNGGSYSPGWTYKESSDLDSYDKFMNYNKILQMWKMENFHRLLSNNEYYETYKLANTLRTEHSPLTVGSAEHKRHAELLNEMKQVSQTINLMPRPVFPD